MRYSLLNGGKRLRAVLCFAGAEVSSRLNSNQIAEIVLPCACAIEMVHAMSLIHDDLPALDNDDMRRGKPTNHKVFGEAIALLAGDALLMMANDVLITKTPDNIDRNVLLEVVLELARATGATGMVGGQVYDLGFTGRLEQVKSELAITADTSTLELIHRGKTGALIKFSLWSGGKLVGASNAELALLNRFSEILGLAFQIADDLLDVTGDIKTLGKTPGKDLAANKVTWTTLYGEEGARMKLQQLEEEGLAALDKHGSANPSLTALKQLLQYAIHRSS
jgi:geranylgeranyl diphosphate synthase type II